MAYHRGRSFSTHDNDNDGYSDNCASKFSGAWWYDNCYCANLNGDYSDSGDDGLALYSNDLYSYTEYSLRFTEMKVRPV